MSLHDERLPRSLRHRSDRESIAEDVAPWIHRTDAERAAGVADACELAVELLLANPERLAVLSREDPPHPSLGPIWRRLIAKAANGV